MNNNFIVKLYRLWKMFNFTNNGDLVVSYAGSKIKLCKSGDIVINAKRHTIHKRDLFFDGCTDDFIEKATRERAKSRKHLERYVMGQNRTSEFTCELPKRRARHGNGN